MQPDSRSLLKKLALLGLIAILWAQCSARAEEVLDQQSVFLSSIGDSVADYSEIGQTFTVGVTGKLNRVEVYSAKFDNASAIAVLTVYNMSGGLPNRALGTASVGPDAFSTTVPTFISFDVSSFQIPVHQNDLMAFAIRITTGFGVHYVLPTNDQNPYVAGRDVLRYTGGPWQVQNESRDHSFKTYVDVASAPLLGDYNGNGIVDAADYTVWRTTLAAGGATLLNDPTPGTVDQSDYVYWSSHFAASGSGATSPSTISEPSSIAVTITSGIVAILLEGGFGYSAVRRWVRKVRSRP